MSIDTIKKALEQEIIDFVDTIEGVQVKIGYAYIPINDILATTSNKETYLKLESINAIAIRIFIVLYGGEYPIPGIPEYCITYINSKLQ